MAPISGSNPFRCGFTGVKEAMQRFDQAAANVLDESTAHHSRSDEVELSDAARDAARDATNRDGGEHLGPGLEAALIDTRMAKYAMVANLKTIQTADEMSKELLRAVDSRSR
jgi:hypothetical protein